MSQDTTPLEKERAIVAKRLAKLNIRSCLTFQKRACLMHVPTRKCVVWYPSLNEASWIYTMEQFIKDVAENKLDKYDTR